MIDLIRALASKKWDAVSGEIIASELKSQTRQRWPRWWAEIRYRYKIEGLTYEGDRVGFGMYTSFISRGTAERAVSRYPKGRIVTVLVSPSDRSSAVIEPGIGRGVVMSIVTGALLAALGIGSITT